MSSKKLSDSLSKGILARLSKVADGDPHVNVGFFDNAEYPNGTNVATVAYWMEKGTKSSKPRPFMHKAIDDNQKVWKQTLFKALKDTDGNVSAALHMLGSEMMADIQEAISKGTFKPNSPLTNLLKDRYPSGDYTDEQFLKAVHDVKAGEVNAPPGKPLVWSGRLLQSVTFQVEE